MLGDQKRNEGIESGPAMTTAKMSPRMKIRRAYGIFGSLSVMRRKRKAKSAQMRLSKAFGVAQPRGWRSEVPAERTRERPAPTWIPFTIGVGMTRVNQRRRPVTEKKRTKAEVVKPAEIVSSIVNLRAMATAAIACELCYYM